MKRFLLASLFILILVCNGCWDRRELENLGLIQTLGIDPGMTERSINVTAMIAIPPKIKGGGGGGEKGGGGDIGTFLISMEAPSIYEAFNRINTTLNREVTLIQNTNLLIGEGLAKKGVRPWIDTLVRFREMRRTLLIFICRGTAAEIMKVKPKLETNPGEYFADLALLSKRTGMFPITTLNSFLNGYEAYAQEIYAPMLEKFQSSQGPASKPMRPPADAASNKGGGQDQGSLNENENPQGIRCIGTSIFKKDKMVGDFDIYESQMLLLLTNKFKESFLSLPDPLKKKSYIVFRLLGGVPPMVHYRRLPSGDHFNVKLKLEADITSIQSSIDYTTPKQEALLGRKIAAALEERIRAVIRKAQQEYGSDVFGFGEYVRRTMWTTKEWDDYHWPDRFQNAGFIIDVKVAIRRVGVQFQPPVSR